MSTYVRCLVLASSVFISVNPLHAEWVQTVSFKGSVQALAFSETNLFAGTWFPGVFLSTDSGTSWTEVNSGLTNTDVFALAVDGGNLFAGTNGGGVFRSTNSGTTWTEINSGLTDPDVLSLAVAGTNLFAGTWGGGVFRSTNNGASWTPVTAGLPPGSVVQAFAISGVNLYAGTGGSEPGGVFLSTNAGASWTAVNSGLTSLDIRAFAQIGSSLFAGTYGGGVFVTADGGANWTSVSAGLTYPGVLSFAVMGLNLFAGTAGGGVFVSTNSGATWTQSGPSASNVYSLAVSGPYLLAGTYEGAVWRRLLVEMVTAVDMPPEGLLSHFELRQNYPNPFTPMTVIPFDLPSAATAELEVFSVDGRLVKTLCRGHLEGGRYQVPWDGRDAQGRAAASGVYLYELRVGGERSTRKMVLAR